MNLKEVKPNKFYKITVTHINWSETETVVAKCTQVQDFHRTAGYSVYHFKTYLGELVYTDQDSYHCESVYNRAEILNEIVDDKLKDTSIIFIDDTHYKKLVNKDKYKEYEI